MKPKRTIIRRFGWVDSDNRDYGCVTLTVIGSAESGKGYDKHVVLKDLSVCELQCLAEACIFEIVRIKERMDGALTTLADAAKT